MTSIRRRKLLQCAASLPALALTNAHADAAWPARPIRFVVGYPAGQAVDLFARSFALAMGKELGQSIVIDNRAGANGIIGAQEVKQAKPDGYSFLFGTSGQLAINPSLYRDLRYDPLKDFVPVGETLKGVSFLLAHPDFPANNVQELIEYARTRPGEINYASGGKGITSHLAMELLQATAGIKLTHVAYKGTPVALNDVMAGRVPLIMDVGTALQHVRSGRLKVLGSTGAKRDAAMPGVPTMAEQGLKDFEVVAWNGIVAPAGTPAAIIAKMSAALRKASVDPQVISALRAASVEPGFSAPEQFGAFMQTETQKWAKAAALAGIRPD